MKRIAYKYRIYPNTEQKTFFAKCFGCVRFFYNKSLSDMNDIYKSTGKFKNITPASYKEDYSFLKEVDSLALNNAQLNRNTPACEHPPPRHRKQALCRVPLPARFRPRNGHCRP